LPCWHHLCNSLKFCVWNWISACNRVHCWETVGLYTAMGKRGQKPCPLVSAVSHCVRKCMFAYRWADKLKSISVL
jgi:hypothetical protein